MLKIYQFGAVFKEFLQMLKKLSSKVEIKKKTLWAKFLPDFQNFGTQIFRKAYSLNKSLFKNDSRVNQSKKGKKLPKKSEFWWKRTNFDF